MTVWLMVIALVLLFDLMLALCLCGLLDGTLVLVVWVVALLVYFVCVVLGVGLLCCLLFGCLDYLVMWLVAYLACWFDLAFRLIWW